MLISYVRLDHTLYSIDYGIYNITYNSILTHQQAITTHIDAWPILVSRYAPTYTCSCI